MQYSRCNHLTAVEHPITANAYLFILQTHHRAGARTCQTKAPFGHGQHVYVDP